MLTPIDHPVRDLVPHAGKMCLLDRVIEGDDECLRAAVQIRADNLLGDDSGVGAWAGIEFMAQAVAAWAGWRARLRGDAPRIGFLLGTRRYECSRARFGVGDTLLIEVRRLFLADNGLGQFECSIAVDGECAASAILTVFEPADADSVLRGQAYE